ncbi:MAG TPA: HAMP domain-containing sensor histidine kinase [Pirellulales bacterium]
MKLRSGFFSQDSHRMWPVVLLLVVAVGAPTLCVLWFMNAAVENERLAVRQRLQDVYGSELTQRQKRLEEHVQTVGEALETSSDKAPPQAFADLVDRGLVQSALVYREDRLAYPRLQMPADDRPLSQAELQAQSLEHSGQFAEAVEAYSAIAAEGDINQRARAMLGQARAMLHINLATAVRSHSVDEAGEPLGTAAATFSNSTAEAVALLAGPLLEAEYEAATDFAGRLIAPNALLLAIESLPPDDARRPELVHRLAQRLRRYEGPEMSSPQRLFLMQQVHQLAGENFSTMAAEMLALRSAAAIPTNRADNPTTIRRSSAVPDLWTMSDASGQTLGIWTTAGLVASLADPLQIDATAGARFAMREMSSHAQEPPPFLSAPAGRSLPDWNATLSLDGPDPFAAPAQRHQAAYLWMACLAIGTIGALAIALGLFLRQQLRLTRLKNDLIATVSHELKTPLASMRVLTDTLLDGRIPSADDQRDYLQLIARENLRLSRLIDNFLTFSRMERQKAAFEFRPLRVQVLVDAALEALGDRAAVVQTTVPPQLTVRGDADALVTLLVNLLDNAWKY